jgi:CCR4-NOT transcriptional regulation complex NOT5 subunit
MAYLYQYDENYCSDEDSDYEPSESSSSSDTDSLTSSESDENETIKEIEYKDMGIPTHIRIYGGTKMLTKNKQTISSPVTPVTQATMETRSTRSARVRKAPVRYTF